MSEGSQYIINVDEAKKILRLDEDYPSDELEAIVSEATSFVDNKTQYQWERDEVVHPLAKAAARYQIQQLFYHDDEHDFSATVISYCEDLRDVLRIRRDGGTAGV